LITVVATFIGLITLLVIENQFFYAQAHKMIELQDEYRSYIEILKKKVIALDESDDQKDECTDSVFPEGVRIYTSESDEMPDSFIVVNRKSDYLKQSMRAYLKEQKLEAVEEELEQLHTYPQVRKSAKKTRIRLGRMQRQYCLPRRLRNRLHKALFDWPIEKTQFWLSSFFGPRKKPKGTWGFHYGIDMAAVKGTPVHAVSNGKVTEARYATGYGNNVLIAHDDNSYKTRYAHLHTIAVKPGQHVQKGDIVGTVGATGFTIKSGRDASHLHFEVYERGKHVDPLYLLA
jgi:murein DD-endopeptidase MepM/ murein hydrolase activator NlpD